MLYNTVQVEVIKLGICNIEGLGLSSKDILIRSVAWLREKYEMFHEELYLQKAVWHIYAYLDLGFPYEEGQKEFQKILSHLKLTVEEVFTLTKWNYKKMPLSFKFNGIFFVHYVHNKSYNVPLLFYLNSRLGMIDKICPVDLTCKFCLIIHNNNR